MKVCVKALKHAHVRNDDCLLEGMPASAFLSKFTAFSRSLDAEILRWCDLLLEQVDVTSVIRISMPIFGREPRITCWNLLLCHKYSSAKADSEITSSL